MRGAIGRLTIAYLILVGLVAIGAFRFEQQRADLVLESELRSHELCVSINTLRRDIGDYLRLLPPRPPVPDLDDPVAEDYFQELIERQSEIASFASRFDGIECPAYPG